MSTQRVQTREGLNLQVNQHTDFPKMKHETIIIPATSNPSWGGYFIFDLKEKSCIIHDIAIQYNVSAISGLTGTVTSYPHYTPAFFWTTRIEVVINNNIIDTVYPSQQFLMNQLFNRDEQRRLINNACGAYDSIVQRNAMATATSNYYVDLWNFFQQAHLPALLPKDDIQLRMYMDTSANNIVQSTLTGTPVSTINFANLIVKLTRLQSQEQSVRLREITMKPNHHRFTECRYGTFVVSSGTQSSTTVLTPLVGSCSFLMFTVRPLTTITGNGYFNYTAITNFAILDSSSTNIVGGQAIPSAQALQILNKDWIKSSYTAETALGIVNNNANVYLYSFSADPSITAETGKSFNNHRFTGNEQLQINYTGVLGASVQIDVYALVESVIEVSSTAVKKITL